jgi:hypothetical protein
MNIKKFNELRVVAKNCVNPSHNGQTFEVAFAELNHKGEPLIFVKVPSEPNFNSLMTLYLNQIDYVKVYDGYFFQYRDDKTKTILNIPHVLPNDLGFTKVASFDVFRKEFNILSLVD